MSLEKKIVISGDSSKAEESFDRLSTSAADSLGRVAESIGQTSESFDRMQSNLSRRLSQLDSETSNLFKDIVSESEKYSRTFEDRLKYIQKELDLLGKINREEKIREELRSEAMYEDAVSKAKSPEQEEQAKKEHTKRLNEIRQASKVAQMQQQMLQKMAEEHSEEQPEEQDVSKSQPTGGGGMRIGRRAAGVGKTMLAAAAGAAGFGAMLSIGGFIGKVIDEAGTLGSQRARQSATGFSSGSVLGMKESEEIQYSRNIAMAMGKGSIAEEATQQGMLERGTGMDVGSSTEFNRVLRSDKNNTTLVDSTLEMLNIMKSSGLYGIDKGDFTMLHELMGRANELNSIQANQMDEINAKDSNRVMAGFSQMGGSFADQRQTSTISNINRGITDPGNEFKNAFVMSALFQDSPDMSLFDLKKTQEEGVFKEGQFALVMDKLLETFSGDQAKFSISKMFNLNLSQSERLFDEYQKTPTAFKGSMTQEQIQMASEGGVTIESIASRGGVDDLEKWRSNLDDSLSKFGVTAVEKISEYVDAFQGDGFAGLSKQFGEDMKGAFDYGAEKIKEAIWGKKGDNTDTLANSLAATNQPENRKLIDSVAEGEDTPFIFKVMAKAYQVGNFFKGEPESDESNESNPLEETNRLLKDIRDGSQNQTTTEGGFVGPVSPGKVSSNYATTSSN